MEEVSQLIDNLIKITDYLYQENIQVAYRLLYLVLPSLDQFISQIEQDEKKDILKVLRHYYKNAKKIVN